MAVQRLEDEVGGEEDAGVEEKVMGNRFEGCQFFG